MQSVGVSFRFGALDGGEIFPCMQEGGGFVLERFFEARYMAYVFW